MSLDLANKNGRAHTTSALDDLTATAVIASAFSGDLEQAGKFLIQVDTSTADIDANTLATSMTLTSGAEAFEEGSEVTLVKVGTDAGKITFTDPITSIVYNYVNRNGESISLVADTSTGSLRWVAKI